MNAFAIVFAVAAAMTAVSIFAEWLYIRRHAGPYDLREGLVSLATYAGDFVVSSLFAGVFWAAHGLCYRLAPVHLSALGPVAYALLLFVALDLTFYGVHRLSHRVPALWAVHVVHHSARTFNLTVALRQSWLSALLQPFWLPLSLLGFEPGTVVLGQFVHFVLQLWVHTEQVPKLGILERVLNTPRHHQVHHAANPQYVDRNFGGLLIVWDRLFGTFVENVEAPRYGVEPDSGERGVLSVVFGEWGRLLGRARRG